MNQQNATNAPKTKTLQMLCHMEGGKVVVTPEDGDRFVVQTTKAVAALQALNNRESFEAQLQLLLNTLAEWSMSQDGICRVHLTLADNGFLFLVIPKKATYNAALEDSLSELDLTIANCSDFDMIRLDVMALPDAGTDALDSFLNNSFNLQLCDSGS